MTKEYTGGSVSYYRVHVANPTTISAPYEAECNDIIEALNMNYAEGNAFKAIWRKCAAELGKAKQGYIDGLYDAEKVEFFGARMVVQAKQSKGIEPTQAQEPSHIISDIPSWDDAPDKYNWLAKDSSGCWFWFVTEPVADEHYGEWYSADYEEAGDSNSGKDWLHTLQSRPTSTTK